MSYDSFSDHSKQISDTVFHILSLRVEPQNGVEVVKPVLEELEVMRLSCALGALSSVSIEEFKHDILEAHEFDVEFARFLRNDVFRSAVDQNARDDSSAHLKVLSLFGKQSEVKKELARLGCWSAECEANMRALDQGIFCAKVSTSESNTYEPVLVLFAWLQDGLFEPQHLHDIVTHVLRFLTCLGPDVVCCLFGVDAVKMQEVMSSVASTGIEDWNLYSVALRIEKQEDEKDKLVAVYKEFIYNRVGNGAVSDLVSVVTFSHTAQIIYEAQDISVMLQAHINYRGGGTTLRGSAQQPADPKLGDELAAHIRQIFAKYDLKAFVVGYGLINLPILKRVADKLGGLYHNVLVGTELKSTFQTISASLGTRAGLALTKPLHECMCSTCQRDLAADDIEKLQPCGHALHASCKKKLLEPAQQQVACPMCRSSVQS